MLCGDGENTAGFSGHSTVFMDSSVYSCLILKGGNMETWFVYMLTANWLLMLFLILNVFDVE